MIIKTYDELEKYISAFSLGTMNLLVIKSQGGLGKTQTALNTLKPYSPLFFNGHITPLEMYKQLYEENKNNKNFLVVFDDIDCLLSNKINVSILKQVWDTRDWKEIQYSSSILERKNIKIEKSFSTNCKSLVLTNDIKTGDPNIDALLTRGHIVEFIPEKREIMAKIATFTKKTCILSPLATFMPLAKNFNLRISKKAEELENAGLNSLNFLLTEMGLTDADIAFVLIQNNKKLKTDTQREEYFVKNNYGSPVEYYKIKERYVKQ